jgi:hypothetical protein
LTARLQLWKEEISIQTLRKKNREAMTENEYRRRQANQLRRVARTIRESSVRERIERLALDMSSESENERIESKPVPHA